MTFEIKRRSLLQMLGLGVVGGAALGENFPAFAQGKDAVTIGWPSDVPSWDPISASLRTRRFCTNCCLTSRSIKTPNLS